jgi:serine/threonine protein kinase/TolB-like protein
MPLEPGQSVGHYRIDRLIGEGGMGAVFLAEDTKLDRKVALKVLPERMAADPERLARFQREAKAIAALNHPHIVTIHSVEEDRGIHFLTMELVEGSSLDQGLLSGGLPLAKVFDIGIALADALAAAHEKGIIHRDLKPANVMVTKDGRVKVLDFGLVKLALAAPEEGPATDAKNEEATSAPTAMKKRDDSLTAAGMVMGTVPYMSPEQVGGETVDTRTDIFSLGVVLYELATGNRPFGGKNKAETISSILRDEPRSVTDARQDAPRHLARIIDHCLQKEPRDRFQTARDVFNELRALRKEVESGSSAESSHPSAPSGAYPRVAPSSASSLTPASAPAGIPGSRPVSAPGLAPASVPSGSPGSVTTATPSGTTTRASGSRAWLWVVGAAAVVLVVGAAFWLGGRRQTGPSPAGESTRAATPPASGAGVAETNSLAVLPFNNMSSDKEQEYFSDGLTEELLNALAKIPDLKVAGRTSSFSFKGKNEDLRIIAQKLGVANILEGSVRKSGNKIRITAQLVKAADGFHLWSETYDRTLDDIFAVQDDIAKAVAAALQVTLLGRGSDAPKPDAEAYDLVLKAHFVLQKRTKETRQQARKLLERALQLSPDYAPAWAEMGLAQLRGSEIATTFEGRQQARDRGRKALERALSLDPNLAVAHSRMAAVQRDSWDFTAAERSASGALAAEPKNLSVVLNAAVVYSSLGRLDEAIEMEERILEVDPLNLPNLFNLASDLLCAGRLDEAEAICRKTLDLDPDNFATFSVLGDIHLLRGEVEAARKSYAKSTELADQGDYGRLRDTAMVEHTAGNAAASAAAAAEFDKRFGAEDPAMAARIRAWRGETDAAFAWLNKAVAARDPGIASIKLEYFLRSLHADPRWNALLKKIGLPTD